MATEQRIEIIQTILIWLVGTKFSNWNVQVLVRESWLTQKAAKHALRALDREIGAYARQNQPPERFLAEVLPQPPPPHLSWDDPIIRARRMLVMRGLNGFAGPGEMAEITGLRADKAEEILKDLVSLGILKVASVSGEHPSRLQ